MRKNLAHKKKKITPSQEFSNVKHHTYRFLWHVDFGLDHQVLQGGAEDFWHLISGHPVQAAARKEVVGET